MSKAPIRVIKFWTKYKTTAGDVKGIDMVEYCAPGKAQLATNIAPISHLSRVRQDIDPDDTAGNMALQRWQAIEPAYEAWKKGHEVPAHGTPLGAWPGITSDQADVFRTFGLKSVEDIAEASDGVITRVQLPGIKNLQAQAKLFLGNKDQTRVAAALQEKDEQIAGLTEQLEELRQLVIAQSQAKEEPPKRRGRPPNVAADEEIAA